MAKIKVFLDSDVVISSLLSKKGAAYQLVNQKGIEKIISDFSIKEIKIVAKRLGINRNSLDKLIKKLRILKLKVICKNYALHNNDNHIVSGAVEAKAKFLLTYNLKHFWVEKIKRDLNILVYRPAQFLQYLRSL